VILGPLTGFFGVANKPLKGVVGVSNVKKIRSDIMEGLKKQQSGNFKRRKRPRSANSNKTDESASDLARDDTSQSKKRKLSGTGGVSSKCSEQSNDEFDDDDDLDLGLDIRGSLPACATARIKGRPDKPRSFSEQKEAVVGSYIPSEDHVTISIDADFKETAKRLKRERRRKQREAEARKAQKNGHQMVGGWQMVDETISPRAPDLPVAPSDMFLGDIFEDEANEHLKPSIRTGFKEAATDVTKNPDEIDLDDILSGDVLSPKVQESKEQCFLDEKLTPAEVDDNEINLDDLL